MSAMHDSEDVETQLFANWEHFDCRALWSYRRMSRDHLTISKHLMLRVPEVRLAGDGNGPAQRVIGSFSDAKSLATEPFGPARKRSTFG